MTKLTAVVGIIFALCGAAIAQPVIPAATTNRSATIAVANTFQTVLAAAQRFGLTIQNNNATGNCWITFGVGITAANATKGKSILLGSGGSFQRYYPYIPNDEIEATCDSTVTLYIDTQ